MDVAEFEDLIDRLGEDLSRWPDAPRSAAEDLLASSSEARALHEEALALRRALTGPPVRAPAGLADRIVTAASKLQAEPAAPSSEGDATTDSAAVVQPGRVLPVLLLALCLLPSLAAAPTPHAGSNARAICGSR